MKQSRNNEDIWTYTESTDTKTPGSLNNINSIIMIYLCKSKERCLFCIKTSHVLKVSKSQKQFFLKLHCQKPTKCLTKFCPMKLGQNFVFWAMEFQEKLLLRFTDLYEIEDDRNFISGNILKYCLVSTLE